MRLFYRNLILAFIMLWLPLQGYASTSMPFCQHNDQPAQHAAHHDMMADAHADHHTAHHHDQHPAKNELPCDQCEMCHLCGAMAIPVIAALIHSKPLSSSNTLASVHFSEVYLEQPQRPPLALSI